MNSIAKKIVFGFFLVLSLTIDVIAVEPSEEMLTKNLQAILPDVEARQVNKTPIDNLYEVIIGPDVIYMTEDARFIFKGDLIDVEKKQNLSENARRKSRADHLKALSDEEYIEFSAKDSQDVIYVFTDVDCGYCRKLHRDVGTLNDNKVSVRYLAYPRHGLDSSTYQQMSNIWCAKDRPQSLTDAKNGLLIAAANCENPVASQYVLGQEMGVRGTPAIFLEDGTSLPGYLPPDKLIRSLGR